MQKLLHLQLVDWIIPASMHNITVLICLRMYVCVYVICATATGTQGCGGATLAATNCLWIIVGGYGIVSVIVVSRHCACLAARHTVWPSAIVVYLLICIANWWVVASIFTIHVCRLRMRAAPMSKCGAQTSISLFICLCLLKPCN